jgi:hypothetical protein
VDNLLATTGIDLTNGGGVPELNFKSISKSTELFVFGGLNCKDLVFDGLVESEKRINLLIDVTHHYHAINSATGAFAQEFVKVTKVAKVL